MSLRRLFPCLKESKSAEKEPTVEKVSDDEEEQGQVDDGGLILRFWVNAQWLNTTNSEIFDVRVDI